MIFFEWNFQWINSLYYLRFHLIMMPLSVNFFQITILSTSIVNFESFLRLYAKKETIFIVSILFFCKAQWFYSTVDGFFFLWRNALLWVIQNLIWRCKNHQELRKSYSSSYTIDQAEFTIGFKKNLSGSIRCGKIELVHF